MPGKSCRLLIIAAGYRDYYKEVLGGSIVERVD